MTKERPCCPAAADPAITQLILPDGSPVGMTNLERILREVADLKLVDHKAIGSELLHRARVYNYIGPGAEADYSTALIGEYRRRLGRRT
jgi:hypothetical protein